MREVWKVIYDKPVLDMYKIPKRGYFVFVGSTVPQDCDGRFHCHLMTWVVELLGQVTFTVDSNSKCSGKDTTFCGSS